MKYNKYVKISTMKAAIILNFKRTSFGSIQHALVNAKDLGDLLTYIAQVRFKLMVY